MERFCDFLCGEVALFSVWKGFVIFCVERFVIFRVERLRNFFDGEVA